MGYINAILSVLCGTGKGAISKSMSNQINELGDNLMVNGIRMAYCSLIGFIALLITGQVAGLAIDFAGLMICLLSAVSFTFFVILWMVCVHSCAMVMIDVALMVSILIPTTAGILFWNEFPKIGEWVGFFLLIVSVIILGSYSSSVREKMSVKTLILLVLVGASNGFCSLSQKLFSVACAGTSTFVFNFYTYIFALPIFAAALLLFGRKTVHPKMMKTAKMSVGVFLVSLLLYLNLMFRMFAVSQMSAALLYPLCQGLGIVNTAIVAAIFYREPITKRSALGIGVAIVALIALNL